MDINIIKKELKKVGYKFKGVQTKNGYYLKEEITFPKLKKIWEELPNLKIKLDWEIIELNLEKKFLIYKSRGSISKIDFDTLLNKSKTKKSKYNINDLF